MNVSVVEACCFVLTLRVKFFDSVHNSSARVVSQRLFYQFRNFGTLHLKSWQPSQEISFRFMTLVIFSWFNDLLAILSSSIGEQIGEQDSKLQMWPPRAMKNRPSFNSRFAHFSSPLRWRTRAHNQDFVLSLQYFRFKAVCHKDASHISSSCDCVPSGFHAHRICHHQLCSSGKKQKSANGNDFFLENFCDNRKLLAKICLPLLESVMRIYLHQIEDSWSISIAKP